jgi:DNA-binding beta-propeller fold protein YncE
MAERVRHALTGYVYVRNDDRTVTVSDPATGRTGHFDSTGKHVSGELEYVDHHMLGHMLAERAQAPGMRGSAPQASTASNNNARR